MFLGEISKWHSQVTIWGSRSLHLAVSFGFSLNGPTFSPSRSTVIAQSGKLVSIRPWRKAETNCQTPTWGPQMWGGEVLKRFCEVQKVTSNQVQMTMRKEKRRVIHSQTVLICGEALMLEKHKLPDESWFEVNGLICCLLFQIWRIEYFWSAAICHSCRKV